MNKKLFFLLFFVINCCFLNAQQEYDDAPWCPKGAMWTYGYYKIDLSSDYLFLKYVYEKDTVIHETEVKTIGVYDLRWTYTGDFKQTRHIRKVADEYLYERNDSIFRYDNGDDCFIFLYSWNFNVGDTFIAKSLYTTFSYIFYSDEGIYYISDKFTPSPKAFFVSNVNTQKFVGEKLFKIFDVQPVISRDTSSPLNFGPVISKIGSFSLPGTSL